MDFLDEFELALIRQDVKDLTADPSTGGSVIYQSFGTKGTFDPNTGSIVTAYAGTWITAYRMSIGEDEIISSNSHYQRGDYRYYLSYLDIQMPKRNDRIIDGTTRYVVDFTTDSIEAFHTIIARNLG